MTIKCTIINLPAAAADNPENYVFIQGANFAKLTKRKASSSRLYPWKGRVAIVQSQGGSVYRLLRGSGKLSIKSDECCLGIKTQTQLDITTGSDVSIKSIWQPWGRLLYYWNHLDDTFRLAARIGMIGLVFGLVSLALSLYQIWQAFS